MIEVVSHDMLGHSTSSLPKDLDNLSINESILNGDENFDPSKNYNKSNPRIPDYSPFLKPTKP